MLAKPVVFLITFILGPIKTTGKKNIPKTGKLIVIVNHISDCDAIVTQYASPRTIHFMAADYLFNIPIIKNILRAFGAFPVMRNKPDTKSFKQALSILNDEQVVGIYPEGKLSKNGKLQRLLPGVTLLIKMSGAPVICCGLEGTDKIIPYGSLIPRPSLQFTKANWGNVHEFSKSASKEEILDWIRNELIRLTPQQNLE